MQKTLFKKYLRLTCMIILISLVMLGLVMMVIIKSYWEDEKQGLLGKSAESIASIAENSIISVNGNQYTVDIKAMQTFMVAFSRNIDADIIVTDSAGKFLLKADDGDKELIGEAMTPAVMEKVLQGRYSTQGNGDLYKRPYFMVGVPIQVTLEDGSQHSIGAVFTACSVLAFNDYCRDLGKMFLLAAIAAFLVAFCMVWLFSYKLVRPLRDMALAAHSFGEGNFAVRVPVTSQDEIGQLAIAFNNMAASLSSVESVRRNFIANVSHELKTPMTTIAGFIDGILDGTIPPGKHNHYLVIVSQEVKRLSRLVRTMLDLSRIDSGELRLHPARFDITNTALVALLSFEKSIEQKQLQVLGLENAESLFVDGDPDMIHQVLYNLIENAVKFTNTNGYIRLNITDLPDRTLISIKNSGAGIPPDEVALIFDRFYKTDKSRSQDKNGMGLGLYIVRTIIKLHGGEITVRSVENDYCEFEFWLPKLAAEHPLPAVKEAAIETTGGK